LAIVNLREQITSLDTKVTDLHDAHVELESKTRIQTFRELAELKENIMGVGQAFGNVVCQVGSLHDKISFLEDMIKEQTQMIESQRNSIQTMMYHQNKLIVDLTDKINKQETVAPTTVAPTTVAPTTMAPTTIAPTTVAPTTVAPTTVAPTTVGLDDPD